MKMEPIENEAQGLWDEADIVAYLKTTKRHLERLREEHGLPYTLVGGKVRYIPEDIVGWVKARRTPRTDAA